MSAPISRPSSTAADEKLQPFSPPESESNSVSESEVALKQLMRRVDWHILPFTYLCYCMVRLDLGNISNAGIMNSEAGHSLKQELHLSANQWAWALSCFYYTYMAIEPISTFGVKLTSPSIWIGRIMTSWGITMCCMAAVKSYGGLVACRVLLGAMEGGYFTGIIYWWSFWYTPQELVPRIFGLYMANSSSGAVSGFLAWAISYADGVLAGWRWLFILEGLVPFFLGVATFWVLPDFPQTSKWLSPTEALQITEHLHATAPKNSASAWNWKEIRALLADPTFWCFSIFWGLYSMGPWAISTVLPQIVTDMGISGSAGTNLLQIPPAATAILFCILGSWIIHGKWLNSFATLLILQGIVIVAYILLITVESPGVRFFAACLLTAASTTGYAILWPRRVEALRGTAATALGIGITNGCSQLTGLAGPQLYKSSFGPRYFKPFKVSLGLVAFSMVPVALIWWLMEGDLSAWPRVRNLVQSQSQPKADDVEPAVETK